MDLDLDLLATIIKIRGCLHHWDGQRWVLVVDAQDHRPSWRQWLDRQQKRRGR